MFFFNYNNKAFYMGMSRTYNTTNGVYKRSLYIRSSAILLFARVPEFDRQNSY